MEGDVTKMLTHELELRIRELENSYAELLGDGQDAQSLYWISKRILDLKED